MPSNWEPDLDTFRDFLRLGSLDAVRCAINLMAKRWKRNGSVRDETHARNAVLQKLRQYRAVNGGTYEPPVQSFEQFLREALNQ